MVAHPVVRFPLPHFFLCSFIYFLRVPLLHFSFPVFASSLGSILLPCTLSFCSVIILDAVFERMRCMRGGRMRGCLYSWRGPRWGFSLEGVRAWGRGRAQRLVEWRCGEGRRVKLR
ncbi:hypothetical protein FB451DRAFT_1292526 [Mycena latifolia]|nr:hypothetical protein FB451DRAFT_1292526 [Mycena latifolia]